MSFEAHLISRILLFATLRCWLRAVVVLKSRGANVAQTLDSHAKSIKNRSPVMNICCRRFFFLSMRSLFNYFDYRGMRTENYAVYYAEHEMIIDYSSKGWCGHRNSAFERARWNVNNHVQATASEHHAFVIDSRFDGRVLRSSGRQDACWSEHKRLIAIAPAISLTEQVLSAREARKQKPKANELESRSLRRRPPWKTREIVLISRSRLANADFSQDKSWLLFCSEISKRKWWRLVRSSNVRPQKTRDHEVNWIIFDQLGKLHHSSLQTPTTKVFVASLLRWHLINKANIAIFCPECFRLISSA